jgi:hypothetical protein
MCRTSWSGLSPKRLSPTTTFAERNDVMINWIGTVVLWILSIYMVTRSSLKLRIIGISISILAGSLLGIGEYKRGCFETNIKCAVDVVSTNMVEALRASFNDIIQNKRLDATNVTPEQRSIFSNYVERSYQKKTETNESSQPIGTEAAPQAER